MINVKKNVVNDLVYFDKLKIVQNKDYFNFSLESILLPNFVEITPNTKKIIDFCTGNVPIPLVLSTRTNSEIYAVEIQKEIYELAKETIEINKLENKIKLLNLDVKEIYNIFETDTFDLITCNPPYFKKEENSLVNENMIKSIARHEILIELEDVIKISKKFILKDFDFEIENSNFEIVNADSVSKPSISITSKKMRIYVGKELREYKIVN